MFKKLLNNKMLTGMFGETFKLEGMVKGVNINNFRGVFFKIVTRNIPSQIPKKWIGQGYNSMIVTLKFTFIEELSIKGYSDYKESSFVIFEKNDRVCLNIDDNGFKVFCRAEFFSVEDITPCIDDRWD